MQEKEVLKLFPKKVEKKKKNEEILSVTIFFDADVGSTFGAKIVLPKFEGSFPMFFSTPELSRL